MFDVVVRQLAQKAGEVLSQVCAGHKLQIQIQVFKGDALLYTSPRTDYDEAIVGAARAVDKIQMRGTEGGQT